MVGPNLHDFLRHFATDPKNDSRPWLWLDPLCIDQSNSAEKNHQTNLLSVVYRNGDEVIAWLGCDTQTIQAAHHINELYHTISLLSSIDLGTKILPLSYAKVISTLLDNPYFSRLWIEQEVMLAHRLEIMCGSTWVDPEAILELYSLVPSLLPRSSQLFWDLGSTSRSFTLKGCLDSYSLNDCSNPRDKVYGLLDIVDELQCPPVDYNKSILEVYIDAVQVMRKSFRDVLSSAFISGSHTSSVRGEYRRTALELAQNLSIHQDEEESKGSPQTWLENMFTQWFIRKGPQ